MLEAGESFIASKGNARRSDEADDGPAASVDAKIHVSADVELQMPQTVLRPSGKSEALTEHSSALFPAPSYFAWMDSLYELELSLQRGIQAKGKPLEPIAKLLKVVFHEKGMFIIPIALSWLIDPIIFIQLSVMVGLNIVFNGLFKWALQRPRPAWVPETGVIQVEGGFEPDDSTPSGHSQQTMAITLFLSLSYGRAYNRRAFGHRFVLDGALPRLSRIHYIHDVFSGYVLGVIIACAFYYGKIAQWYFGLGVGEQVAVWIVYPALCYSGLFLVKRLVPGNPKSLKQRWREAVDPPKLIKLRQDLEDFQFRRYGTYSVPIWGVTGGGWGLFFTQHVPDSKFPDAFYTPNATPIRFLCGWSMYVTAMGILLALPSNSTRKSVQVMRCVLAGIASFWGAAVFSFAPLS